ncbi:N-acetylornithine carbamoyltransferase [Nibribacter ruber]|uniref:N-succinylornithine carbamoyltransferase n=1 Tax=Nibribacter ruber TaxID=2698458 RepID=A0A6P1P3D1_9BACT|nr:N-acetylornithine carbamoyltransferase [Nibribacter ruber]QHL88927.1 N-acetylornithine carbamoyltransferase [Nibribacter ruber]
MKQFTSVHDVEDINALVQEALELKKNPYAHEDLGKRKTLGLIFLNPSLRTRLSTQKAAQSLGMNVMVMNMGQEGWALETQDGAIMNGTTVEHIKDAAAVMGEYCDVLGLRSFPKLQNVEEDYSEEILKKFIQYANVPFVSLESATRHPLQSLADLVTITEHAPKGRKPKVVLTWGPHVKALPQAVPNSFAEWMCAADVDFVITHPEGYELDPQFTNGATITYNQQEALEGADFIYVKNWSTYQPNYGEVLTQDASWMLTNQHLANTNNAKVMHCLPVRRNVELSDEILDGPNSLVVQEAANREFAAQAVLKRLLKGIQ